MFARRPSGSAVADPVPGSGPAALGPGDADPLPARPAPGPVVAPSARPRVSDRCGWQVEEGEAELLDHQGKRVLGLNGVGSFVFPLLDGSRSVSALAGQLAARYGIEARTAERDLQVFLADLARRGFVEGVER